MNVYGYIRVSTDAQKEKGYSLPEQEERITAYCKSRDWHLVKIYTDPGFTGSNINRPGLTQMIKDIDGCDLVLVNKLDRLSRSQKDTLYLIQDVFAPHGVSFVSMQESFDTTTPIGIAMVGILSAFAQLERSQIKERTKMGKEARKKKGLWHGGCNIPIGYDYIDGKLVVNDDAPQIRLIYDKFLNGETIRDITRYLSAHYENRYTSWNYVGTVRRILSNPVYIGMVGDYKGQHEPIVDKNDFDRIQVILNERKTGGKSACARHLLTGMIYCGECGKRVRSCQSVTKKARYSYYRCGRIDSGGLDLLDHKCNLKPQKEEEVDQIVINEILKLNMDTIKIVPKSEPIVDNSAEIQKIDKQIERLIDLYAVSGGDTAPVLKKINSLKTKKKALEKVNIRPVKVTQEQILETVSVAKETLLNGEITDKIMVVSSLIDKVTLFNDTVQINWKF